MNKQQFIKAFAEKANFTQKDAGIAFEAMAATIAETLKTGEKIQSASGRILREDYAQCEWRAGTGYSTTL